MLEESTIHSRELIINAEKMLSTYFNTIVHVSKVIQLSESDRRNLILRLMIDSRSANMPKSVILKQVAIEKRIYESTSTDQVETEQDQLSRFAHDWAGLEFLTTIDNDHAPKFYAGNVEHKFILIEDLGIEHPSLVGPLTRKNTSSNQQEAMTVRGKLQDFSFQGGKFLFKGKELVKITSLTNQIN